MSDLIKRSDAIKALRKLGHEVVVIDKVCSLGVAGEFIDAIRTIPSADRPQGEWHNGFYEFLWNVINPNEMQRYIEIYEAQPIAVDGAQMKGAEDE